MSVSNSHLWREPIRFDDDTGAPRLSHKVGATFDGYSGAPDDIPHLNPIGHGPTRYAALLDLLADLDDPEQVTPPLADWVAS